MKKRPLAIVSATLLLASPWTAFAVAPCDQLETVGGGAPGVSPGPTSPIEDVLGWDIGSGQCNGSFTVARDDWFPSDGNGLELGIRAEQRRQGQVANNGDPLGLGEYTVETGPDDTVPVAANRAWWNFQLSVAYDGLIDDLDGLVFAIRTDAGPNQPAAPQFDFQNLCGLINARNNAPNPTVTYSDFCQVSQNPEFGWFTVANDTDGNLSNFDYDQEGAWLLTLAAIEDGQVLSTRACISTLNETCNLAALPAVYTCSAFAEPLDEPVMVRKPNRVLPLRMVCTDETGMELTDADIAPPEIEVTKLNSNNEPVGTVEEITSAGRGTDGNQFEYGGSQWQFNLSLKSISAEGTYAISVNPGGDDLILGGPTTTVTVGH